MASLLPVIDFCSQELKPGTSTWESVKGKVRTALEEFGCFHALYDKIPEKTRKKTFDTLRELFDQPLQDIAGTGPSKVLAYFERNAFKPLHESIAIPRVHENINSFTTTIWPQGNSTFSETIQHYVDLLSKLDRTIRTMVLESFGLERYKEEHMNNIDFATVFNKYTPPQTNGAEAALPSHTDKGMVTILDQNGMNGLEVMMKDDQWINVSFSPNSFFVLIGDSLHAWTNGRLHQPPHRVIMTEGERYSISLQSMYKIGYMVKAPEELIDENHPKLYNPFDISGLFSYFYGDQSNSNPTLKGYCGYKITTSFSGRFIMFLTIFLPSVY